MTRSVAIIGGGIAGLATAALMAKDGYAVTVFERKTQVGGRAGSWEHNGFRFDTGPSWYLMPEVFDHFFQLMGTSSDEQIELGLLDPGYRVYFEPNGTERADHLDVHANRAANVALFESVEPGAGAKLETYLDSARDVYELAKEHFLYTSFEKYGMFLHSAVLRRAVKLVSLLTVPLSKYTAKRFKSPKLQQILGYPAVFLGSSPFLTPAMYHLMSYLDLEDGVLYPKGGFTDVIHKIRAVAEAAGVTIHTGADVREILTEPANGDWMARAGGLRYTDATGEHEHRSDLVVSAADLHFTETALLPKRLQTYPESYWDRTVAGPSAVLVYLGVKGEVPELLHHTLLFTADWEQNFGDIFAKETKIPDPASIYVCRPSATDSTVAPNGDTNLFILVPIPADPGIGHGGLDGAGDPVVESVADRVIDQISSWAGVPDLADRITVRRTFGPADFVEDLNSWRGSALGPSHVLKQSAFFRAKNVSKRVYGLFYVGGSTIPGIGLPMCLISAEALVKRLRGDTSSGPLPVPLVATVA